MEAFWDQFPNLKHFNLEEIKSITGNFSANNFLGEGGFGKVYKGEISDSEGKMIKVAFKRSKSSQGNAGFMKEIVMLSSYKHDNLISLLGVCDKGGEKILAYEHASNGSLDTHLGSSTLTWTLRLKICLGAARGLAYLHDPNGAQQRVIHQDIKSSNILLDENWNAKISDMGLSKTGSTNTLLHSFLVATNIAGTPSYIDPVYLKTGILTKESDVYSFGVVLFEVMCGSLCVVIKNNQNQFLMPWWKKSYKEKKLDEIIFHDLKRDMDMRSLTIFSEIAYQCLLKSRAERPQMYHVVEKLEILLKIEAERKEKIEEEKQKKIEAEKQEKMRIEAEKQKIDEEKQENMRIEAEKLKKIEAEEQKKIEAKEQEKIRIEAENQKKIEAEELKIVDKIQEEIFAIALNHERDISKIEELKEMAKSMVNKKEVEMLLSTGIIINGGNSWFSLNKNGEHCQMISAEGLFLSTYQHLGDHWRPNAAHKKSRFEVHNQSNLVRDYFTVHLRTQYLSPNITYKVNLVFQYLDHTTSSGIIYRSTGDTIPLVLFEARDREDGWMMNELYQFTNGTGNVDLEITFMSRDGIEVEGIEFLPMEELQLENGDGGLQLEDGNGDVQRETYWEQKLPENYEEIIKWSKDRLQWTTMKELYYIFCKGFLINNGEEWFSVAKNGKICLMLSAKLAFESAAFKWKWQTLPESRFPEVAYTVGYEEFDLHFWPKILSRKTTYAIYLVYKLPEQHCRFEHLVRCTDDCRCRFGKDDFKWLIYLVAPKAQIITGKFYQTKGLPQQRNDGWMEVQLYEFQTAPPDSDFDPDTLEFMRKLIANEPDYSYKLILDCLPEGLIVQGITIKPIDCE